MTCWKVVKSVLILCLILIPIFVWMTVWNGPVHYLPYYLPCPEIFSMKLQYAEEKPVQLFPERLDVLTLTPWLAPIVWEGTFNSELLDSAYEPLNLTIGVTAFAVGKYTMFVGRFVESAEKLFMKGYRVKYYIFTNDPQVIPRVQLQPGRSLSIVPIKKYSHWQEISMRRMEAINRHIAEVSHREVNYLFCLDIDMVFHNPWGVETLGEMVAAIHPGYYNVPRSQFPYERRSSSTAFIPDSQGDFYYAGAVFGGLLKQVYEFTRACHMTILADKANGIMAAWQEESHLNKRFFSHKPSKLLSPEYVWDDTKPKPPEVRLIRFSTVNKNYKEIRD
ncbi:globoside alpha-1,3-N-acetylgalactosaminyltransferase 1 isoform X2 [Terrapene carolina triunguis]|uniref:globoside alpha-1,3-N-acetylgalactosaminyltransferase 1 isoform X2 n=1 Tax=Terrapene triunguis TaxID=2587831 RepID=UPI000E77DA83|nr:globoside alpha-1,3-N-acetylgalactosaminyltransferase 1 isoform X2 [Terrapene carolina triunguis]